MISIYGWNSTTDQLVTMSQAVWRIRLKRERLAERRKNGEVSPTLGALIDRKYAETLKECRALRAWVEGGL